MAFQPLSVHDILLLSQQAWSIGRAFTKGKHGALEEFAEVEREANGLSDALKLTCETLHKDGSVLSRAGLETRKAVNAILESAQRTLDDLESFVDRYQVIRKRQTNGGFVVEKSWSEVLMANYKTCTWTTEGGNITDLRNMLQMHTNTIILTMQALQSQSLDRLERIAIPMAENISSIHERVNGDLGDKIDDVHRIIMAIAESTPSLRARSKAIEQNSNSGRDSSSGTAPVLDRTNGIGAMLVPEAFQTQDSTSTSARLVDRSPHDSVHSGTLRQPHGSAMQKSPNVDYAVELGSPSNLRGSVGGTLGNSPNPLAGRSPSALSTASSSHRNFSMPRRDSATLPSMFQRVDEDDAVPGSSQHPVTHRRHYSYDGDSTQVTRTRTASWDFTHNEQSVLPPPAIPQSPREQQTPATPSSLFGSRTRSKGNSSIYGNVEAFDRLSAAFKASLLRNAAILCDVRGKLLEYARHNPDEPDPRYRTEMVEACDQAQIYVIRKRENLAHGGTEMMTSIWTLSEDGAVRCQQKLPEEAETVPYCSYFQPEKVSLGGADIALKFHGSSWGDTLQQEVMTSWVNYVFNSKDDASEFQSAVLGRRLIGTFQTTKTIVIHSGVIGAFALEEQFANIEMLRLWRDNGISTPGADGGVFALMHLSSNFGEGWARWWMNNSRQQIRVTADGSKYAKVKGIDVAVVKPGTSAGTAERIRRSSTGSNGFPVRKVTGIKIEFKTVEERDQFIALSRKVQEEMVLLPDF